MALIRYRLCMAAIGVLKALEHAWKFLEPLQLPMAIMGGLALSLWKYPRATRVVDLLGGIGSDSPDKLIELLRVAGFRFKRPPPSASSARCEVYNSSSIRRTLSYPSRWTCCC